MSRQHSITAWLAALKSGDESAAERLWERCFQQIRDRAQQRLGAAGVRDVDGEDIAQSALHALYAGARDGRFPKLDRREDLWRLLFTIAARKSSNAVRRDARRSEVGESALHGALAAEQQLDLEDPRAFETSMLACEELIQKLESKLRDIAYLKLQGFTNEEIAARQERSVKTIERYLQMIRSAWS
ncbi:MAG: hypothetical protein JNM84_26030 [Planctomycetes bacterium]|nr:hypothetical protein [Planctomycetota bacterium]